MDPLTALTLVSTVLDISKDIYSLGRWIYDTASSAKHHDEERKVMIDKFYSELLKLQSFGRLFEKSRQDIKNEEEDLFWLRKTSEIFSGLDEDFAEYKYLAIELNSNNSQHRTKPSSSPDRVGQKESLVPQELDREPVKQTRGWFGGLLRQNAHTPKHTYTPKYKSLVGMKWVLFESSRFQRLVDKLVGRNSALQDALVIAMVAQLQRQLPSMLTDEKVKEILTDLMKNNDAKRIGLSRHAEIQSISMDPGSMTLSPVLYLQHTKVISTADQPMLHEGMIETHKVHENYEQQKVLIE
ncbi:hypothetical protein N7493_009214 [Penicillium malachiteum]|uniref:Prion-inhibition and propagation HeLo domain-containing protein n=1 Tax=Penicillium malachiteum TaxID=1324776 RepID=A0AAD6HGN6_9EURO|nr:hypothetical protein N7493_009214 [Penicillium malachiteum]